MAKVERAKTFAKVGTGYSLRDFLPVRTRTVKKLLQDLDEENGTGPDALSARVLKRCCATLCWPVAFLVRLLLHRRSWPSLWRLHWVLPLYKKKAVYDANNYRGVHLTCQLAKVTERVLKAPLQRYLEESGAFWCQPVCLHNRQGLQGRAS